MFGLCKAKKVRKLEADLYKAHAELSYCKRKINAYRQLVSDIFDDAQQYINYAEEIEEWPST